MRSLESMSSRVSGELLGCSKTRDLVAPSWEVLVVRVGMRPDVPIPYYRYTPIR